MKIVKTSRHGSNLLVSVEIEGTDLTRVDKAIELALEEARSRGIPDPVVASKPIVVFVEPETGTEVLQPTPGCNSRIDVMCGPKGEYQIIRSYKSDRNVIVVVQSVNREALWQHDAYELALCEARRLGILNPTIVSTPKVVPADGTTGQAVRMPGEAKQLVFQAEFTCGPLEPW